jgi:CheY-like chemotaxis protein
LRAYTPEAYPIHQNQNRVPKSLTADHDLKRLPERVICRNQLDPDKVRQLRFKSFNMIEEESALDTLGSTTTNDWIHPSNPLNVFCSTGSSEQVSKFAWREKNAYFIIIHNFLSLILTVFAMAVSHTSTPLSTVMASVAPSGTQGEKASHGPMVEQGPKAHGTKDIKLQLPGRRRVIFPYFYKRVTPRETPVKDEPELPVKETPKMKASGVFSHNLLNEETTQETLAKVDVLLALAPLKQKATRSGSSEETFSIPSRPVPIKTMDRPPLASLEIPEVSEHGSCEQEDAKYLPCRNILIRDHSMPVSEGPPKGNLKEVVSILRRRSLFSMNFNLGSLPSLKSLKDEEDSSQSSVEVTQTSTEGKLPMRRSVSEPSRGKSISFDPRIWVREFQRSPEEHETTWYTEDDMNRFKRHALALVMACNNTEILPTGTARTLSRPVSTAKAFFTHSALTLDCEDDPTEAMKNETYRGSVAQSEMKSVLLVDPHDICLTLFTKAFKSLLPNVELCTATSSEEALGLIARGKIFDIILVEERLKQLFHCQNSKSAQITSRKDQSHSGSAFFRTLSTIPCTQDALFIGVSAHLEKDKGSLEDSGVDLCWSKPPPKMSQGLRDKLLKILLLKRGRKTIANELFGSS